MDEKGAGGRGGGRGRGAGTEDFQRNSHTCDVTVNVDCQDRDILARSRPVSDASADILALSLLISDCQD